MPYCAAMQALCDCLQFAALRLHLATRPRLGYSTDPLAVTSALGYLGSPASIGLPSSASQAERLDDPKAVPAAAVTKYADDGAHLTLGRYSRLSLNGRPWTRFAKQNLLLHSKPTFCKHLRISDACDRSGSAGITPFRNMIEARSADYVMVDLCRVGGVAAGVRRESPGLQTASADPRGSDRYPSLGGKMTGFGTTMEIAASLRS